MGGRVPYFKKPVVEFESDRQCIWTDSTGKRCENKAQGYFFCKEHFKLAGNIVLIPAGTQNTTLQL